MYLEHYGLKEPPFSITPDPRFVFLSERHRDALAHLLFGIGQGGGGGFVQLTGEVGTGKTTLSRLLLEQTPENTRVALVLNPRLSPVELLETICEELHLPIEGSALSGSSGSVKALTDALNAYLLDAYAQGLRVVLIVDEAQNLSVEALEQVRLLTNLETDTQKLLQIILLGQPELRDILARPELRQLAQRITARYHLTPLDADETAAYLRHRYRVAGGLHLPFEAGAIKRIHAHSAGVPRLINVIAERALLGGYAHDDTRIDARSVDRAAKETLAPRATGAAKHWWLPLGVGAGALALIAGVYAWRAPSPPSAAAIARTASTVAAAKAPARSTIQPQVLDADALAERIAAAAPASPLAWKHLLELWRLPSDDLSIGIAASCPFAVSTEAYCLRARGALDRLVAQDRPVLLHLADGSHEAWAVLLGADGRRARLSLDGRTFDVDRIALARYWNGDYAALWRGPGNLTLPLADNTPGLIWVRDRLTTQYLPVDAVAMLDADMHAAVLRFQGDRGLGSDGVIGPETLMALAARDDTGPRLLKGLE
ncbi:ExeA family protein [Lysobacter solisilvae (ex Woo and Kim 2020)]|uniref:AAA family ATPase n=1 Tax=Agrilutibacter terrestris TaxID=2865112 RepID=A0A7H0FVD6_9GAMM|nr:AAA family ATPase [Lysobacter terrestris]QNP40002.1 AAA family ATPase [Lysobacter terrestris]